MAELRKCKECGKMFQPKGREQYCSDIHYRPCPVCGKPVVAKYLSDPARRCDACKGVKGSLLAVDKPEPVYSKKLATSTLKTKSIFGFNPDPSSQGEVAEAKETTVTAMRQFNCTKEIPARIDGKIFCDRVSGKTFQFIRTSPLVGFQPQHIYTLNISQDNSAYIITTIFDNTLDREIEFNGKNSLQIRCTSQTSFYNYFQPVWQGAEEVV